MDRLSEGLRTALSPAMAEELRLYLQDLAEEAQHREHALNSTLQKLLEDMKELECSRRVEEEERQGERRRMHDASEAARRSVQEDHHKALTSLKCEAQRRTEEYEVEREKTRALERELKRVSFLLEQKEEEYYNKMMAKETDRMVAESKQWARWTKEREESTLSIALSAAAVKQRLLRELKSKAERWMVFGESTQGKSIPSATPAVFQTWSMREQWRILQGNQACLNDGLQSFIMRKDIEKVLSKYQAIQGKNEVKFEKKMQESMTKEQGRQDEIRAAEQKKQLQLEEKMRKKLQKIQKAELKEKEKQEAKDKKEAERLERKRAKEERERARVRRPVFCFWPSGPQTTM